MVVLQTKTDLAGTVTVQNLLGQQVYTHALEQGQSHTLDLTNLLTGTYVVRLQQGDVISSRKLVIQ